MCFRNRLLIIKNQHFILYGHGATSRSRPTVAMRTFQSTPIEDIPLDIPDNLSENYDCLAVDPSEFPKGQLSYYRATTGWRPVKTLISPIVSTEQAEHTHITSWKGGLSGNASQESVEWEWASTPQSELRITRFEDTCIESKPQTALVCTWPSFSA